MLLVVASVCLARKLD